MNRTLLRASRRAAVVLTGAGLLVAMTAGPSSATTDLCISVNGTVRVQMGTATCSSVAGAGNVAIARGANSCSARRKIAGSVSGKSIISPSMRLRVPVYEHPAVDASTVACGAGNYKHLRGCGAAERRLRTAEL